MKAHERTKSHEICVMKSFGPMSSEQKKDRPILQAVANITTKQRETLTMLFNTAYAVLKAGRPFSDYEFLCSVQLKNNIQLGENYITRIACRRFLSSIVHVIRNEINTEIKASRFLSILGDGSTDASIVEQEIVYLRYVDQTECVPKTREIDIIPLASANADGVFRALESGLQSVNLNFNDLKHEQNKDGPMLVGVNFDGAAVMMGVKSGVVKKITDIIPEVIAMHCVAHKLELAALDANKSVKYMEKFEDTIKGIYNFYHYSPKRRRELTEICAIIQQCTAHFSSVKQVRWLASKDRAVKALKMNLPAVVMHLQHSDADKARGYYKEVTTVNFIKHIYFMLDYLSVLATLSRAFQQEGLLVMELHVPDHIECTLIALTALKNTPGKYMKEFTELYNPTEMEFGDVSLTGRKPGVVDFTKDSDTKNMIDNTVKYIEKRFNNLNTEQLSLLVVLDFHKWPINNEELAVYGNEEIHKLVVQLESCFTDEDRQCIDREWLFLKMYIRPLRSNDLLDVYSGLLRLKPNTMLHILKVIEFVLTISPSTASCERGFSNMNNVKTSLRTSLTQQALADQLHIVCEGPSLADFNADKAVNHWLTCGTGERHLSGHKTKNTAEPQLEDIVVESVKKPSHR
ncbi:zinc finger protein 862-like [Ptychodera flava]|uniref:zinc finger protein 862-like n=1 Tax=Ptychodera flava TaxID=63121 RepID=UPI00396A6327